MELETAHTSVDTPTNQPTSIATPTEKMGLTLLSNYFPRYFNMEEECEQRICAFVVLLFFDHG